MGRHYHHSIISESFLFWWWKLLHRIHSARLICTESISINTQGLERHCLGLRDQSSSLWPYACYAYWSLGAVSNPSCPSSEEVKVHLLKLRFHSLHAFHVWKWRAYNDRNIFRIDADWGRKFYNMIFELVCVEGSAPYFRSSWNSCDWVDSTRDIMLIRQYVRRRNVDSRTMRSLTSTLDLYIAVRISGSILLSIRQSFSMGCWC